MDDSLFSVANANGIIFVLAEGAGCHDCIMAASGHDERFTLYVGIHLCAMPFFFFDFEHF